MDEVRLPAMGARVRVNSEDGRAGRVVGFGYRLDDGSDVLVLVELDGVEQGWLGRPTVGEAMPLSHEVAAVFVRTLACTLNNVFLVG